jgi:NCAIR mutase (PurE)-related protein
MTRHEIRALLEHVRSGTVTPESAQDELLQYLRQAPYEDLGFARVDHHRSARQGFPEVVFGPGKSAEQIAAIAERIVAAGHTLLVTRTDADAHAAVAARIPDARFHPVARTITRRPEAPLTGRGTILVLAAGTADQGAAEEAAVCAETMGNRVDRLFDVGVAGLHRLLAEHARLLSARVVIVAAGMEGALPSVVGGLVDVPVIAVPTSIGYGASFGGLAALLGMLNSCASGVSVVNIDNGFGAAAVASSINHLA